MNFKSDCMSQSMRHFSFFFCKNHIGCFSSFTDWFSRCIKFYTFIISFLHERKLFFLVFGKWTLSYGDSLVASVPVVNNTKIKNRKTLCRPWICRVTWKCMNCKTSGRPCGKSVKTCTLASVFS